MVLRLFFSMIIIGIGIWNSVFGRRPISLENRSSMRGLLGEFRVVKSKTLLKVLSAGLLVLTAPVRSALSGRYLAVTVVVRRDTDRSRCFSLQSHGEINNSYL